MTSQNFSFTSGELYTDGYTLAVDDVYGSSGSNGVWRWDIMAGNTRYDTGSVWCLEYTHSTGVWRCLKPNENITAVRSQTANSSGIVTFPEESPGTGSVCTFTESNAFQSFPPPAGGGGGGGGGGGAPLSNNYQGTLTVNGSNLNWAIPNAATTGNYELMSKVLPSGNFVQELPIAHTAYNGGNSGYVVNFDTSKQWILRAPDGSTLDTAGASPTPSERKVFCNFW